MISRLKSANALITAACGETGSLSGYYFYDNKITDFKIFPCVGTKLLTIDTLATNAASIIATDLEVAIYVIDLLENHDDLFDLYESITNKLNILLGVIRAAPKGKIEIIDDIFSGNKKGAVAIMSINI